MIFITVASTTSTKDLVLGIMVWGLWFGDYGLGIMVGDYGRAFMVVSFKLSCVDSTLPLPLSLSLPLQNEMHYL